MTAWLPLEAMRLRLAEADRDYRERVRRWERNEPQRRAGQAVMERANARRAAELGQAPPLIAAGLAWTRPSRAVVA